MEGRLLASIVHFGGRQYALSASVESDEGELIEFIHKMNQGVDRMPDQIETTEAMAFVVFRIFDCIDVH